MMETSPYKTQYLSWTLLRVHISKPTSSKETLGGNGVSTLAVLDCAPPSTSCQDFIKDKEKKMEIDGVGI